MIARATARISALPDACSADGIFCTPWTGAGCTDAWPICVSRDRDWIEHRGCTLRLWSLAAVYMISRQWKREVREGPPRSAATSGVTDIER